MTVLPPSVPTARSPHPAPPRDGVRPTPTVTAIASEALFKGADEVQIHHAGSVYRLKRTSLGKLILTK